MEYEAGCWCFGSSVLSFLSPSSSTTEVSDIIGNRTSVVLGHLFCLSLSQVRLKKMLRSTERTRAPGTVWIIFRIFNLFNFLDSVFLIKAMLTHARSLVQPPLTHLQPLMFF